MAGMPRGFGDNLTGAEAAPMLRIQQTRIREEEGVRKPMKIGFIGGTGLYSPGSDEHAEQLDVHTPYGDPSERIIHIQRDARDFFFLARHGIGHRILPSEINHRANIFALRKLGVRTIIAFSAVGSLREEIRPGDFVLPDQYLDRTKRSADHTFFGRGIVAHISFAQPICGRLRSYVEKMVRRVCAGQSDRVISGGTYVNIEGPAFSTPAESNFYRLIGCDVIGMTSLAEAKLSREAGICYTAVALVTDYDAWQQAYASVSVEEIVKVLSRKVGLSQRIIQAIMDEPPDQSDCPCRHALDNAIVTDPRSVPEDRLAELQLILPAQFLQPIREKN